MAVEAPAVAGADVHQDIARDIGQQVEMMILSAKHANETKVGKEIQKVKALMEKTGDKIKLVAERLAQLEPASNGLLKAELLKSITKLEEVWETEVGTLKHELWQTIQAHNHNSDLLKHHKEAIDQIQARISEAAPNPELEAVQAQIEAQLLQANKIVQREKEKETKTDAILQRVLVVQEQITAIGLGAMATAGTAPGFPGMAQMAAANALAAAAAGKKGGGRGGEPKRAAKAMAKKAGGKGAGAPANAASLRAEAPEFVPTFSADT
mmetsp:Transcript_56703/g.159136  ORF Transcript_56703/g.159136 Transcript_56703/m.159136 type:complete len:267 (-) Transcript_56703:301-1101(-)